MDVKVTSPSLSRAVPRLPLGTLFSGKRKKEKKENPGTTFASSRSNSGAISTRNNRFRGSRRGGGGQKGRDTITIQISLL